MPGAQESFTVDQTHHESISHHLEDVSVWIGGLLSDGESQYANCNLLQHARCQPATSVGPCAHQPLQSMSVMRVSSC